MTDEVVWQGYVPFFRTGPLPYPGHYLDICGEGDNSILAIIPTVTARGLVEKYLRLLLD